MTSNLEILNLFRLEEQVVDALLAEAKSIRREASLMRIVFQERMVENLWIIPILLI